MKYDIRKIPFKERIQDYYVELETPTVRSDPLTDKLLRYTIYLYDKESPLREIQDVKKRKDEAVKLSNLNEVPDPEDKVFIKIQRHFFKVQGDKKFELMASGEELLSQLMLKVRQPVPKTEKSNPEREMKTYEIKTKCFHEAFKIQESIDKLHGEIFIGNVKEEIKDKKAEIPTNGQITNTAEGFSEKHT